MLATMAQSTLTVRILFVHVTIAHGGAMVGLVGSLLVGVALIVSAWALGHAVGTPGLVFTSVGRAKWHWVVAMIVLLTAADATGLLVALYYLIWIRPRLNDASGATRVAEALHR